jgi:hypothetical protein
MKMPIHMVSPTVKERKFLISTLMSTNCTDFLYSTIQITQNVICPRNFVIKLLEMMGLTGIVEITGSRGDTTTICVTESNFLCELIMTAIKRTIAKTYYPNISKVDAQEIITRLRIKDRDVYYIDGDEFGCLVVLHELDQDSYEYNYHRLPYVLFQGEVSSFNSSRTIVMTHTQLYKYNLLPDKNKPSIEFTSVRLDRRINVVFRKDANPYVVNAIKKHVEINNLELKVKKLKKLKRQSK